jgi:serine/threonine-protein kinase PRP4
MWAAGACLFEAYRGKILFRGKDNNGLLRSMMEVLGPFDHQQLQHAPAQCRGRHFDTDLNFVSREKSDPADPEKVISRVVQIERPSRGLHSLLFPSKKKGQAGMASKERKHLLQMVDLLYKCLALDPAKRITAKQALKHPFVNNTTLSGAKPTGF